jgi:hypothetical protein
MNYQAYGFAYKLDMGIEDFPIYFRNIQAANSHREKFEIDGGISIVEMTPELEEQIKEQEAWLEKMQRPGRIAARAKEDKVSIHQAKYIVCSELGDERKAALDWIQHMNSKEFQDRLLNGTLPKFTREEYLDDGKIKRDTNHHYSLMSEECHKLQVFNKGYVNRMDLRYMSTEDFKKSFYQIFWHL